VTAAERNPSTGSGVQRWGSRYVYRHQIAKRYSVDRQGVPTVISPNGDRSARHPCRGGEELVSAGCGF
jgi:hypothetical protein